MLATPSCRWATRCATSISIRSGAVEIFRRDGALYNRLGAGEIFGQIALMTARPARFPVRALEDTLVYLIPDEVFRELFDEEEAFADYVEVEDRSRLRRSASQQTGGSPPAGYPRPPTGASEAGGCYRRKRPCARLPEKWMKNGCRPCWFAMNRKVARQETGIQRDRHSDRKRSDPPDRCGRTGPSDTSG